MSKIKILFVCMGNICRSPAAEGIMKKITADDGVFEIDSAATHAYHTGEKADIRMRQAASKRGYNLESRSRKIDYDDFEKFDMIVTMDDNNYHNVIQIAPNVKSSRKVFKMAQFLDSKSYDHIPDPYYQGHEGFEIVLDLLEEGCKKLKKFALTKFKQ